MKLKNFYRNHKKLSILVLIFIILILSIFLLQHKEQKIMTEKCPYLDNQRYGKDISYIDCFNIFSIEHESPWLGNEQLSVYNVRDDKNNYNIATVSDLKRYKVVNNYLYIFDDGWKKLSAPDKPDPVNYSRDFYINSKVKEYTYPHLIDMPNFIRVKISSG